MNNKEESSLVYHLEHGRSMPGCLPLFVLIAGVLAVLGMELVEVQKPKSLRPRGEGDVYYRNDELLHFHAFQRSPLPLRLPVTVDPAQAPDREMPPLSSERRVSLLPAPAPALFGSAPDSAVLEKSSLLRLPPPEEGEGSPPEEAGDAAPLRQEEGREAAPPAAEGFSKVEGEDSTPGEASSSETKGTSAPSTGDVSQGKEALP